MAEQQTAGKVKSEGRRASFSRLTGNKKVLFPVIILVVMILAAGGWYIWNYYDQKAPSGWTTYKDAARGFRFDHPKDWGPVKVTEKAGEPGKTYLINLAMPKAFESNQSLLITMESEDFTEKICTLGEPPECITEKGFINQKSVKESLARIEKTAANPWKPLYDSSSYTLLLPNSQGNTITGLHMYQVVNLPKIKVTAVSAAYGKSKIDTDCPKQQLANDSKKNCITNSNYQTLNKILKSFRSI